MKSCNTESSLDLPLESLPLQPFLQSLHKEQWQEVRLGDSPIQIIDGDRGKNYPKHNDFLPNGYCLFLNTKNIPNSQFNFTECQFIDKNRDDMLRKGKLQLQDIVMTTRGTIGNIALYDNRVPYNHIRINSSMVILRPNIDKVVSQFLLYAILSSKENITNLVSGSAQPQLPIKDSINLTIPLPPLTTQQKIAEILSSFDDKIDLLHRQNKTLESLALTLFRHYFIDNPNRSEWEEKPLSEIAEIQNGYAFKNSDYTERGMETYEVLKMGHIESGGGLRYFPKAHYVKINDKMTKWVLNEDDIVLAMTDMKDSLGILGYPAMVDKSNYYVLNQRVARIYLKSKDDFLHNYFLFLYLSLQENIQKLQSLANGGVQVNLSTEAIKNFTITIPPLEFQSQNNQAFINIIKKYKNNRKQIQNLQAMRDLMLRRMFESVN
ncbi:restriction endonuclease subunit S [Helicobacter fennelliae]|uniref:restriction endonuclease subunit S n=1 Tax=Helicobacter fennelliae TaxID=215 RepID=UPI000DF91FA3|nr:restriction endonuclease subunit S [Helicobacter fennelliae]STQ84208.1 putative type I restriction enzyme specificity protein [Helicobacter fennelliae]